ncbi:winged helix-turn-helix transcriptional regulator [bacterium]|nr:MAG: winged helix-turn-helix transcriptional regulator [bacterium]
MHSKNPQDWEKIHGHIRQQMSEIFAIEDTRALELFILLQRSAHLSRMLDNQLEADIELSGPRWQLLLRLLVEEKTGNCTGVTPTGLSHSQRVSKNTISALLRGLESQGLIQRALDPADLRAFRIQLTPAGRDYLLANAPRRFAAVDQMLSGLDPAEQDQLITLLNKLQRSFMQQIHLPAPEPALEEE